MKSPTALLHFLLVAICVLLALLISEVRVARETIRRAANSTSEDLYDIKVYLYRMNRISGNLWVDPPDPRQNNDVKHAVDSLWWLTLWKGS